MKKIKAGIFQSKYTSDRDKCRIENSEAIRRLAAEGCNLVVLSELHDGLYFCQTEDVDNFKLALPVESDFSEFYSKIAGECGVVLVTSMFERRAPGLYHNTAVVFDKDGSRAGIYRKMHIPDDPGFYEKFYFTPGDLGFTPIDTSLGRLGVLVCWDQWYPEAARIMALKGAEILIYPTAIGYNPDDTAEEQKRQREAWITIQRSHAVANGIPVISVNRTGYEPDPSGQTAGIDFWGSSFVAGPQGEFLASMDEDTVGTGAVEIDPERCENVRCWWPFFRDRRIDDYDLILKRFGN